MPNYKVIKELYKNRAYLYSIKARKDYIFLKDRYSKPILLIF